ncbi:GGDEF/EAL domain-containing response regulator [Rhodocyclus tenuis]|uniref:Diguanylate cyclase (GGDEF)-like protein n=1 Tax=Rhodocyclus tenuis TaxID=1066 RepID=A0A840G2H3_RHOTE|nr:EAL domain-containing protein [Rhodocyclus tenuis]MBB4246145.1 diguanylate cyclase (GGDEF)-like protein [Rhodocyclus tenuis]
MTELDDLLLPLDDGPLAPAPVKESGWKLLIVDDDEDVHAATRFALAGVRILGQPLTLAHAHSSDAALALLDADRDFALILLDVVMESEDAGLALVGQIRSRLGMTETRIILRTGQPGYAPELAVFNDFDINDYRTKAELTRTRLITTLTAALRSYRQLREIADSRRGLELIVRAAGELMGQKGVLAFGEGMLGQLKALLAHPFDGFFCVPGEGGEQAAPRLLCACGRFADKAHTAHGIADDGGALALVARTFASGRTLFSGRRGALYLRNSVQAAVVYFELAADAPALAEGQRRLVEVFAANLSACFGKVRLVEEVLSSAHVDGLTQLANRTRFILDLDALAAVCEPNSVVALLDIEHFADINDGLGHDVGNALLQAIAQRLRQELGSKSRLARIGADVFGLIGSEELINPENLFRIFATPFAVSEHSLPVSASIGLSRVLEGGLSGISLLKRASIALGRAKSSLHLHHEYFIAEMEDSPRRRLEIIRQLREDFDAGKLALWYQPQVALDSGEIVGIETLARWPQADGEGFVHPPSVFIPLAEYSGLIVDIGEWVVVEACAAFARLRELGLAPRHIAVNVSMPQFRSPHFSTLISETLARHALPAGALELEITESVAMDEPKIVANTLRALKRAGARIAIDDFGTGYSSLNHLRELPIDCLKIDRSFIDEIGADTSGGEAMQEAKGTTRGGMFAETIIALGRKLGIATVAEGVETAAQAEFVRAQGGTIGQGYFFARPMPFAALVDWLAARRAD